MAHWENKDGRIVLVDTVCRQAHVVELSELISLLSEFVREVQLIWSNDSIDLITGPFERKKLLSLQGVSFNTVSKLAREIGLRKWRQTKEMKSANMHVWYK
jgi:hypothetical protein